MNNGRAYTTTFHSMKIRSAEAGMSSDGHKSLKQAQGEETRATLIETGARLFGQHGYSAVSMRTLAAEAGVNLATVSYHFGGKAGLYEAIVQTIIDIRDEIFPPEAEVRARLERAADSEARGEVVDWFIDSLVHELISRKNVVWGTVIISRELAHPTEIYAKLEKVFFDPTLNSLCALVSGVASVPPDREEMVITAHCVIGLIIKLLEGQRLISKRLGWESYEGHETTLNNTVKKRIRGLLGLPMENA